MPNPPRRPHLLRMFPAPDVVDSRREPATLAIGPELFRFAILRSVADIPVPPPPGVSYFGCSDHVLAVESLGFVSGSSAADPAAISVRRESPTLPAG